MNRKLGCGGLQGVVWYLDSNGTLKKAWSSNVYGDAPIPYFPQIKNIKTWSFEPTKNTIKITKAAPVYIKY
jgi:hypothetical protein